MKRSKPFKVLVIPVLALLSFSAVAQDTLQISLDKAVQLSADNSKQLKIAQSKILEAEARLVQSRHQQLPQVGLSGAYLRVNSPDINLHFNPAASNPGEGGGESSSSVPEVSQAMYGTVNLTQPIFTGLKIKNSIEAAGYLKRASKLNAESQKDEVLLNTIAAYYNYYKLSATRQLVEQSLEQARQRVTIFTNLEKNGVITRNDLLKAQLQESNLELTALDVDNNLAVANFELDILLGLPEETQLIIDTLQFQNRPEQLQALAYYLEEAPANRPDLEASQNLEKAAESRVKVTQGDYYPSLALRGGYIDAYIPNLVTVTNAVNVGVGVQYNLSGIFTTHQKVQEARAQQQQQTLQTELQLDEVKKEIFRDYAAFQKSLKKIETLKVASEQANENYRITQNNYNNNLALITDLLDAEVAQLQAQVNALQAQADAQLSYYQLEKAAGLLNTDFSNQN